MELHTYVLEYCRTCPLYRNNLRFVPPEGSIHAPICIVGQSPGTNEFFEGRPFIGKSGEEIAKFLIPILGTEPPTFYKFLETRGEHLYITNACVCEVLTPVPKVKKTFCYDRLHTELRRVSPNLIVTFGGQALEYVTKGELTSILSSRGFLLRTEVGLVLPTIHPAGVMRQPELRWLFEADMKKLARIVEGTYSEPSPLIFQINTLGALEELTRQIESLPEDALMSFDLETTDTNPFRASIICLSLSFEDWVGYTIPMDDPIVTPYIKRILASRCRKVAQNCKFDLRFLKRNGFCVTNMYFDTMIAQHVLNENLPADLNTLITLYLDYPKYDRELEKFKKEHKIKSYAEIPQEVLFKYAAHDAIVTRMIALRQIEEIRERGYEELYWKVEFPVQLALVDVELTGVLVDKKRVDELTKRVVSEIQQNEQQLFQAVGYEFNYKSSKQLTKALYTDLKFPVVKRTPTGSASANEETLQKLKSKVGSDARKSAVITALLKLRARQKLLSTYLSGGKGGIWKFVENDGRVHPDFKVTGTVTGRLSAADPPIQTIPKSAVRSIFTVPKGYRFIEADLNSAELYALAWYARCKTMLDQLNSGEDFHIQTAERIFKKKVKKGDIERKLAKFAVYGISYGRGAHSMADQFKLSLEEAQRIVDSLFEAYPEISAFLNYVVQTARERRVLRNVFGRTRIFPRDCEFVSAWERQALNFLPQSTVADHTNQTLWMLQMIFNERGLDARVIIQLHDAIMVEAHESVLDEVVDLIQELYTRPVANTDLVIPVDIEVGDCWKGGDHLFEE